MHQNPAVIGQPAIGLQLTATFHMKCHHHLRQSVGSHLLLYFLVKERECTTHQFCTVLLLSSTPCSGQPVVSKSVPAGISLCLIVCLYSYLYLVSSKSVPAGVSLCLIVCLHSYLYLISSKSVRAGVSLCLTVCLYSYLYLISSKKYISFKVI
jgi:hypothetical protein